MQLLTIPSSLCPKCNGKNPSLKECSAVTYYIYKKGPQERDFKNSLMRELYGSPDYYVEGGFLVTGYICSGESSDKRI